MIRVFSGLVICCAMFACTNVAQESSTEDKVSDESDAILAEHVNQPYELKWLEYADPVADANLAIAKSDFTLLAFTNRGLRFPGIAENTYKLEDVTQRCGIKVLKGTGDALQPGENLDRRKKLRAYAKQYNVEVFKACLQRLNNDAKQ